MVELLHEVLLLTHEYAGCGRRWRNLSRGGHVGPQVLVLHAIVVVVGAPRHLAPLDVGAPALRLVGVGVAFLVLAQVYLDFVDVDVLSLQGALVNHCCEVDCGLLGGLGARSMKSV